MLAHLEVAHGLSHGLGSAESLLGRRERGHDAPVLVAKVGDRTLVGGILLEDERELLVDVIADEELAGVVRDGAAKVPAELARRVGVRSGEDPDIARVDVRVDARPVELGLELGEQGLRGLGRAIGHGLQVMLLDVRAGLNRHGLGLFIQAWAGYARRAGQLLARASNIQYRPKKKLDC
jgi:hypothetical protein